VVREKPVEFSQEVGVKPEQVVRPEQAVKVQEMEAVEEVAVRLRPVELLLQDLRSYPFLAL
jgi:hypothetical protein